jgi:O-acetyl-ADP-ribose deacetylase (regulator of RNase III)
VPNFWINNGPRRAGSRMGKLIITDGDIFEIEADIIVNPVNCIGKMGMLSGAFSERYPKYAARYRLSCGNNHIRLGHPFAHFDTDLVERWIVSFPTMKYPGELASRWAITLGLYNMTKWYQI